MKMRIAAPLLASLVIAALAPAHADVPYFRYDATVGMQDGVSIDASLYVPDAPPPTAAGFPLIVRQHGGGSNKDNPYDTTYGLRAVATGRFALLMYSHRGHGNSGGIFDFFGPRTTLDFSEMLDWVASSHPEVDVSNTGVSGYSQGGGESLLPAEADARVNAVAVGNTFADLNQALNPGDCYKLSFSTGIFLAAYKLSASRTDDATALRWGAQLYTDTEDVPLGVFPSTTADLASRSPVTGVQALVDRGVPVFWTQSWEDQLFPGDHPERILGPLEAAGVPVHYWFASGGHAAGPNFPDDETQKEQAMLDWFEQYLLGIDHGFASAPKVDYWQRTAPGLPGTWVHRTAAAWPLPGAQPLSLYPRAGGALGEIAPPDAPGRVVNDLVNANVANDAITNEIARNVGIGDVVRGVPETGTPLDTLSFDRALTAPLEVTGQPVLEARISTTAPRAAQLDAKIWDIGPGGAMLVNRGCLSFDPATGGTQRVMLWPNSHVFPAGHTLRLTIAAVDFPTFKADTDPAVTDILAGTRVILPVV